PASRAGALRQGMSVGLGPAAHPKGAPMQYEQQSPPDATLVKAQGRQEVLYTLTDRLHRAQACEDVLDASFWALIRGLSCDRAAVLLMDASATLHVAASHGLSEHYGRSVQA